MTARLPRHHIEGHARTAVNMTALPNQRIMVDTSAAPVSITMPDTPALEDGDAVEVAEAFQTPSFGTNALTMVPAAGQTIEGSPTFDVNVDGMLVEFVYDLANTNWDVTHAPGVSGGGGGGAGAADTDGLPEGTTNLYHTEARVTATPAVAANTAAAHTHANKANALDRIPALPTSAGEYKLDRTIGSPSTWSWGEIVYPRVAVWNGGLASVSTRAHTVSGTFYDIPIPASLEASEVMQFQFRVWPRTIVSDFATLRINVRARTGGVDSNSQQWINKWVKGDATSSTDWWSFTCTFFRKRGAATETGQTFTYELTEVSDVAQPIDFWVHVSRIGYLL